VHRLWIAAFLLGFLHSLSLGTETRMAPMLVMYFAMVLGLTAGLVFWLADGLSVYGSYVESFEAPDPANGATLNGGPPEPELSDQLEAGVRVDITDRLRGTLSLFRITKENVVTPDPANFANTLQIGEQQSQGVELELTGRILPGWEVLASGTYNATKVVEGVSSNPVTGAPTNVAGNRLPNIPEWAASLATQYTFQPGSELEGFTGGVGIFYRGSRPGDLNNTFTLNDYVRVDANVGYRYKGFIASINVRNIFNEDYFVTANQPITALPGAPTSVEFTVGYRF